MIVTLELVSGSLFNQIQDAESSSA